MNASPLAKAGAAGPSAPKAVDEPPATASQENRAATRLPAARVPAIKGVRLSPHGVEANLINISTRGVLVECDRRLKPGSTVKILFDGGFEPSAVPSRIARCSVAGIGQDGALKYHVGIAFVEAIPLEGVPAQPPRMEMPLREVHAAPAPSVLRNRW